jgi:acetyltransferase-like isoleucine patch superfamily enzyme
MPAPGSERPDLNLSDDDTEDDHMFKLKRYWRMLVTQLFWRLRLGALGGKSVLYKPMLLTAPGRIFIGAASHVRDFSRLEVIHRPELGWDATLKIGSNVNIEQGVHIVCQCNVTIEDDVSITPFCAVVDTYHPHDPPDVGAKIGDRLPTVPTFVHIGRGSFIGMKSVILPNVRIGEGCIIGAGSIVSSDIPDYCVAVGAPARVVKRFDPEKRTWHRVAIDAT